MRPNRCRRPVGWELARQQPVLALRQRPCLDPLLPPALRLLLSLVPLLVLPPLTPPPLPPRAPMLGRAAWTTRGRMEPEIGVLRCRSAFRFLLRPLHSEEQY